MFPLSLDSSLEVWFIDAPITLLYCVCRSYKYQIRAIVVERLECSLDIQFILDILEAHSIEVLDTIKIIHPKYSCDGSLKRRQGIQARKIISEYCHSKIVVRSGSGFSYFIPPWKKVTLLPHGFGDFSQLFEQTNPILDIFKLIYYSTFYIIFGFHQLRFSSFKELKSISQSVSSKPFIDLSLLRRSDYFNDLLSPLKYKLNSFARKPESKVILCLPSLKSSDLLNVYTESTSVSWIKQQVLFFTKYANENTLLVFKHHPAVSLEEAKLFNDAIKLSNVSFIDINDLPNCNHDFIPVELLMYLFDFDLLLSPGTAALINKPHCLQAFINPYSVPDTKFQQSFLQLTSSFQFLSHDYSATIAQQVSVK